MSPFKKIIVFLSLMLVIALAIAGGAHVNKIIVYADNTTNTTYLGRDEDTASTVIASLTPGKYIVIKMPYDVGFSDFGDDEHKDSEVAFQANVGNVDIHVGLGNDNVLFTITHNSKIIYEKEIAHQSCVYGCEAKGSVTITIYEYCDGTVKINGFGAVLDSVHVDPAVALNIMGDNDASVMSEGTFTKCTNNTNIGIVETGSSTNYKLIAIMGAAGLLTIAGMAALAGGGRE